MKVNHEEIIKSDLHNKFNSEAVIHLAPGVVYLKSAKVHIVSSVPLSQALRTAWCLEILTTTHLTRSTTPSWEPAPTH